LKNKRKAIFFSSLRINNGTNMDLHITFTFCKIDDFLKQFESQINQYLIGNDKGNRGPECSLSISEIMTILVLFQSIGWRNFKVFYTGFVVQFLKSYFAPLPSYNRFAELMPRVLLPMTLFAYQHTGKKTGIYYIDSTKLPVCELARSKRHKVFKDVACYGKTSVGWFFGLKLHLIVNHSVN
jgi:Transposase DDE domain